MTFLEVLLATAMRAVTQLRHADRLIEALVEENEQLRARLAELQAPSPTEGSR
jgi:hypothetical protein